MPAATKRTVTAASRAAAKKDKTKPIGDEQVKLIQSAAEGSAVADDEIEFKGQRYKIADTVGIWPMMQFARAAEAGIDLSDWRALGAMHALLETCIAKEDWGRFQEQMISTKEGDLSAMLDCATSIIEKLSARPTQPPSQSSNGRSAPGDGSTDGSSPAMAAASKN